MADIEMSQKLVSRSSAAITCISHLLHTWTEKGLGEGSWARSLCYFAQLFQGHSLYGHSEWTEKEKANSTLSRL